MNLEKSSSITRMTSRETLKESHNPSIGFNNAELPCKNLS